ncbi:unnamed protein product [Moneuplotes crassus]|uniref:Uncharacterized protein n=1 Tax=Euplotes crassus TaxID=5936 RepID=A0AAD1XCW8_EUPCR|nr:unnamed protein product [Moneuplotes crassus]
MKTIFTCRVIGEELKRCRCQKRSIKSRKTCSTWQNCTVHCLTIQQGSCSIKDSLSGLTDSASILFFIVCFHSIFQNFCIYCELSLKLNKCSSWVSLKHLTMWMIYGVPS